MSSSVPWLHSWYDPPGHRVTLPHPGPPADERANGERKPGKGVEELQRIKHVFRRIQDRAGYSSIKMTMRYSHLSPQFQRGTIQLLNGLCAGVSKPSEASSERIVKNRQKDKEVRQPESPNLLSSLVELNGIELGASRCRPSACRSDRSPFWSVN